MPPFTPTYYPPSNSQVASNASKPHPAYWSAKPAVATSSPSLSIAKTSKVIKSNDPNESQVVSGVPNASGQTLDPIFLDPAFLLTVHHPATAMTAISPPTSTGGVPLAPINGR
ncbi:hypothetical protein FRB96_004930 [Tulasnella sp. 330]|nr:hypothetical protein FRB96_004930 [Tulasnella sp. 330]KAG8877974.1 hypothetical protein FRB98_006430 [Tulasnella sp. 332]